MTLWEILKANKTGIAPDMFTMLAASKMNGGRDRLHELSGIPPLSFTAKGNPLTAWSITGNTVQDGTPTPDNPVEVLGCGDYDSETGLYRIPVVTRGKNLFNCNDEPTLSKLTKMYTISNLDINKYYTCSTSFEKIPGVTTASLYFAGESSKSNGVWKDTPITFKPDANGQIAVYVRHATDLGAPAIFNKVISGEITIMVEEGTTATPYEPYHVPITTPIYLPTPLYSGEVMRSDGTITRSDGTTETFTAPQIPTLNGTTVIDVDTAVKPESMTIKYRR